ncbi:putative dolichyl-diphosphooligosaccharide--protein glycosyltransferase [Plasmodium gaboni]|uniref:Dolichyl-diphosphooligosaccharide--protein glycosyltransferase 48 kDa subunit n=1 Tax=Plasmodium gaboni TaxID=647221 RepID=A0A151LLR3_9APIC|nr:putative dolichyl-diphosphooligosaccharide--protein glycosyltransferase [Plasmodium gaboni]KYO00175.1 putative dolichyl-diphosphooligosaccharide--protein glycosyltransferase [Plasmodium gaboni]
MKIKIKNFLFILFLFFFVILSVRYSCEKKKLQTVDYQKKSITGKIKNRIQKYQEKKLILITDIRNINETYSSFLHILNTEGNYISKIINILSTDDIHNINYSLYDGLIIILDILNDKVVEILKASYLKLFIEKKKHIFFSLNDVNGKNALQYLNELNISVHGNSSYVNDYFNNIVIKNDDNQKEITIKEKKKKKKKKKEFFTNQIISNTPITSIKNNILFKGTAHSVLLKEKYFLEVLTCTRSCLLYDKNDQVIKRQKQGTDLLLISAIQLENNSRILFSSSSEIFSDYFFNTHNSNKQFTYELIKWNLKKSGIIRYNNFKFYKNINQDKAHNTFFINDFVNMSIDLYELKNNFWVPYKNNNIQIQMSKIHIISRTFLNTYKSNNNPTYYTNFQLPKEHGIYKLQIYYLNKGYNILNLEYSIPIRTLLHYDKNKKVKFKNYPFYFYIYLSLIYFIIFLLIILFDNGYLSDKKEQHTKEKLQ